MSEEDRKHVDMRKIDSLQSDQSDMSKSQRTNRELLRRQSMPLLLPSIYEQQCLKRRKSSLRGIEESGLQNFSDQASSTQSIVSEEDQPSGHRKLSCDYCRENKKETNTARRHSNCPERKIDFVNFPKRRSMSVDFGITAGGGKHTLEREGLRTNSTLKFKRCLEEMERQFSDATLEEVNRLRKLSKRRQSEDNI